MKTLTVRQPWATLIIVGAKQFETRSWATAYRGELAIHAAMTFDYQEYSLCLSKLFRATLEAAGVRFTYRPQAVDEPFKIGLPLGAVLGTVQLVECQPTDGLLAVAMPERAFGNFERGRWAWVLKEPKRVPRPIRARGHQGLWNWSRP